MEYTKISPEKDPEKEERNADGKKYCDSNTENNGYMQKGELNGETTL